MPSIVKGRFKKSTVAAGVATLVPATAGSQTTSQPQHLGPTQIVVTYPSQAKAVEALGPVGDGFEVIIEFDPTST